MFALKHGQLVLRDKVMFVLSSFFVLSLYLFLQLLSNILVLSTLVLSGSNTILYLVFMLRLIYHNLKYHTSKNHILSKTYKNFTILYD